MSKIDCFYIRNEMVTIECIFVKAGSFGYKYEYKQEYTAPFPKLEENIVYQLQDTIMF